MASRRERRLERFEKRGDTQPAAAAPIHHPRHKESLFHRIYNHHYKTLLIIPILLLVLALVQIGYQTATTGDFIHKGASLKGGLTFTVPTNGAPVSPDELQSLLTAKYPTSDIVVRGISELGALKGIDIEAATDSEDKAELAAFEKGIIDVVATKIPGAQKQYSVEVIGPSLGAAFFDQVFRAMLIAFLLMALVIFLSFGEHVWSKVAATVLTVVASFLIFNAHGGIMIAFVVLLLIGIAYFYITYSIPSSYAILCAFSDIVVTVAVVNLLGIKVSTAGIAAFLMLIGYSVDTDILLTTRVLKHKRGTVYDRVLSSLNTGITMSLASMAAALVGIFVSQSSTIREIMIIILIGLAADIIMTWIQNVALLRMYVEKHNIQ